MGSVAVLLVVGGVAALGVWLYFYFFPPFDEEESDDFISNIRSIFDPDDWDFGINSDEFFNNISSIFDPEDFQE